MLELTIGIAGLVGIPLALGLAAFATQRSLGRYGYRLHVAAKQMLLGIAGSVDSTTYRSLVSMHSPGESLAKAVIKDIASDTHCAPDESGHFERARREYDLLRFVRRYGKAARAPGHRKVRGWNLGPETVSPDPGTGSDLVAVPWYARLREGPVAFRPAIWKEAAGLIAAVLVWAAAGIGFCVTVFATAAPIVIRALAVPAVLAWALIFIGQLLRDRRRAVDSSPPLPTAQLVTAALVGAVAVWIAGPGRPLGWIFALFALVGVLTPWLARRFRRATWLRRSVGAALRDYNAFGPVGIRPRADRPTGKVLREVLTNLPATRLFLYLPYSETGRVPYTIVCGNRIALLCPSVRRASADADALTLSAAVASLEEALPDTEIHGWVLWPTLPKVGAGAGQTAVDDVTVEAAAGHIGPWLADGGNHYDLAVLQMLRLRLATVSVQSDGPTSPAAREHPGEPIEAEKVGVLLVPWSARWEDL